MSRKKKLWLNVVHFLLFFSPQNHKVRFHFDCLLYKYKLLLIYINTKPFFVVALNNIFKSLQLDINFLAKKRFLNF